MKNIDEPLNVNERYLYGMVVRLDALCNMMSSFLTEYAKTNEISTEGNKSEVVKTEEDTVKEVKQEEKIVKDTVRIGKDKPDYNDFTKAEIVEALTDANIKASDRMLKGELVELAKLI